MIGAAYALVARVERCVVDQSGADYVRWLRPLVSRFP
jgi:hypothetical protein